MVGILSFQKIYRCFLELVPKKYLPEFRRDLADLVRFVYRMKMVLYIRYTIVAGLLGMLGIITIKEEVMKKNQVYRSASGAEQFDGTHVPGNIRKVIEKGLIYMKNNSFVHMLCTMYSSIVALVSGLLGINQVRNRSRWVIIMLAMGWMINPASAAVFKAPTGLSTVCIALGAILGTVTLYSIIYDLWGGASDAATAPRSSRTEKAERENNFMQGFLAGVRERVFAVLFTAGLLFVGFGIEIWSSISSYIFG